MRFLQSALIWITSIVAASSTASCYGGMGHGGMMGGGMGLGMILVALFWLAVVVGVVLLIVWLVRRGKH